MNKRFLNYSIFIGLALLFLAPGIAAYFFYRHPEYLGSSKINKGQLLNPPIFLNALGKQNKWKLILWASECDKLCSQQLEKLSRIRLALGRGLYDVDLWLLIENKNTLSTTSTASLITQQNIFTNNLSSSASKQLKNLASNQRVFIANPENYLILGYEQGVKSNDIYTDLKLLLNTNKTM